MTSWLRRIEAGLGRRGSRAAYVAIALGMAAFTTGLSGGRAPRTFAVLIATWLFFAGIAAGALAFVAFFRIVDADWARPLAAWVTRQGSFAPVALLVLVVILAGARLAPWLPPAGSGTSWLSFPILAAREVGFTLALFGFARLRLIPRPGRAERPTRATAVIYCLLYAVVLSLWAFDFVLGPAPAFESTLVGPFLFMAAFLAGTGLIILLALARGALSEEQRRDAGTLMLALSIFWAYLFWSQYLTIWYGDLPQETAFALRRAQDGWSALVLAVLAFVFAVPFVMLLHPRGRRSSRVLGAVIVTQLFGLWLSHHLLVVPSLTQVGSSAIELRDVLILFGMLGAFAAAFASRTKTAATASRAET